ncbi:MAG: FliM/FliN family flagellar motor C-terminal domain-containing protein [Acidobacteriia bacterium]|nr:FliM/FliN family flagellar motor C-terminal domain-containing protein [Terriglobia bacterium]
MATAQVAPVRPEVLQAQESGNSPIEAYHWLRCKTTAEIAVPKFTVGDLLKLRAGSVVQTATPVANDVPVRVNKILLGWGRFEAVNDQLAIRITELA